LLGERMGTLARVPITGAQPREILDDLWGSVDWAPDGENLAVVRADQKHRTTRLEFPVGKTLYEAPGIYNARVSPEGDRIAFLESSGLSVVDRTGKRTQLLTESEAQSVQSLAWHPSGREIWFERFAFPDLTGIFASDLAGKVRRILPSFDSLILHGINGDGELLVERAVERHGILFGHGEESKELDVSWLDWSHLGDLSPDGRSIVFTEPSDTGELGDAATTIYLRQTDGSPPVRLGVGIPCSLSPSGKWVMARIGSPAPHLVLLPTSTGEPRPVPLPRDLELDTGSRAAWILDDRRAFVDAKEKGRKLRTWLLDLEGGKPRPFTPEGVVVYFHVMSPDGRSVFCRNLTDMKGYFYPVEGGQPREVAIAPDETPIQWSETGDFLYIVDRKDPPIPKRIWRFDVATGKRTLWRSLVPSDVTGVTRIGDIQVTADGKSYVYEFTRMLSSDLFIVSGLK